MTDSDSTDAQGNPYETPLNAEAPTAEEPSVTAWVGACSVCGATVFGLGGFFGQLPPMMHWVTTHVLGNVIVGGLIGGIVGRVIGRLLVARFRFRQLAERSAARRAEFEAEQHK